MLLDVVDLEVAYGDVQALFGVSFHVDAGEIVSIVGSNAAGKTTSLKTIAGILAPRRGTIAFDGARTDRLGSDAVVERGVVLVPEGRQLFPAMTVLENLELGAFNARARSERRASLARVFEVFPVLEARAGQLAGTLSGGEQQMVAIGRALMSRPRLLMLDEPSLGLAPMVVNEIFAIARGINAHGTTILLVEQNVHQALAMSDRGYILENGRIVLEGKGTELLGNEGVRKAYLGM